jgi:hypothetical protein
MAMKAGEGKISFKSGYDKFIRLDKTCNLSGVNIVTFFSIDLISLCSYGIYYIFKNYVSFRPATPWEHWKCSSLSGRMAKWPF